MSKKIILIITPTETITDKRLESVAKELADACYKLGECGISIDVKDVGMTLQEREERKEVSTLKDSYLSLDIGYHRLNNKWYVKIGKWIEGILGKSIMVGKANKW